MCYTYVSVMFYLNTCFYVLVLLCRLLLLEEDKVNFNFLMRPLTFVLLLYLLLDLYVSNLDVAV